MHSGRKVFIVCYAKKYMKSKFALWSWVSPVIGLVQSIIFFGIIGNLLFNVKPPTPIGIRMLFLFDALLIWAGLVLGLIFGISALIKIKKNPKINGKVSAIIGIVISILLIPYAFLMTLGPLMGD